MQTQRVRNRFIYDQQTVKSSKLQDDDFSDKLKTLVNDPTRDNESDNNANSCTSDIIKHKHNGENETFKQKYINLIYLYLAYMALVLCRKSFSFVLPFVLRDGRFIKSELGWLIIFRSYFDKIFSLLN